MLQLTDVHVRYGGIHAAKGVSMRVAPGGIVTLIGANGAGKSTILRAIAGLVPQRTGSIVFMGRRSRDAHPRHRQAGPHHGAGGQDLP